MEHNRQLIVIADSYERKTPIDETVRFQTSWLRKQIKEKNVLYTGLLPGLETEVAEIALTLKVPYIAVIPYKNRYLTWSTKFKNRYLHLIKKSVKTIYVDREPGHVSLYAPPDVHSSEKTMEQARWLINKAKSSPGITPVITYRSKFSSMRSHVLTIALNDPYTEGKLDVTTKAELFYSFETEDDLPF